MTAARSAEPETAQPTTGVHRRKALLILAATALLALLVDLGTKHLALATLDGREPVRLLGGAVYLSLLRNGGAAWSLGSGYTWVFPLVTVAVVGWIGWLSTRLRSVPWAISLGLVLGGALGNLTDRIFRAPGVFVGHVVDMISVFGPYGRHFPVFNLADSALVVGVLLAVLLELTGRQRDGTRARSQPPAGGDPADVNGQADRRNAERGDADRRDAA